MKQQMITAVTAFLLSAAAAQLMPAHAAAAAEKETTTTTTTTVVTETVTTKEKTKKPEWKPFKVCVLDFTTIDEKGQKKFLDEKNNPIVIPTLNSLNDADHRTMNAIMQGYVRMIDAHDNARTNEADREAQIDDNRFSRQKALDLYNTIVKGEPRPTVIGAEYLSAYLGRHSEVFGCMDVSQVAAAMEKLQKQADFPKDFMLRLAKETGATHLIYGTVSDLHTKTNSFTGYGIQTKTTTFQLDVIVKMVDLVAQHTVYSNVYTGSYREQRPISADQFDNDIFESLMKSALEQAAEDFYDVCKEGRRNKVTVTPMPHMVTVTPSGKGSLFSRDLKTSDAEIYADGVRVASGGETFPLSEGQHTIEVKADGWKTKTINLNVDSDLNVTTTMEKN